MELSEGEMAQLLMQDEINRVVTLVVNAIAHVRTKQRVVLVDTNVHQPTTPNQPTSLAAPIPINVTTRTRFLSALPATLPTRLHADELHAPSSGSYGHRHSPEGGRLPPLAFSKYFLGEDFLAYIHNFEAIEACRASDLYMINQLKYQMVGDAKDLLDAQLPTHMTSWRDVKALALSLFASQDLKHEAWDFLYTAKYIWGDNLDVHYSKFIKHAKRATRDQHEFMQKTAMIHFTRSLPQDLMREAGLCTFSSDYEMFRHLKKCMLFSTKPIPETKEVRSLAMEVEEEGQTGSEELEAVVSALQSFGWQKKQEPIRREREKSTFVRYPCSLCGKHGHNIMK
jgi:hypothetical protein